MMANKLLTSSIIARMMAKELSERVRYTEDVSSFHCQFEFECSTYDRTMTVDDFWTWKVRPAINAALCYAENGSGAVLELPPGTDAARACLDGVEVRVVIAYDVRANRDRNRLDARYPA